MSEQFDHHYLDELTAFVDRTGEVPPGLDDELTACLLIHAGRGDEVIRKFGDPEIVFNQLPHQLQDLCEDGALYKQIRYKLKSGKYAAITSPEFKRSRGTYAEKQALLEKIKQHELHPSTDVASEYRGWVAMALRLDQHAPDDFRAAWDKFDIVERLLVVEERQEAPSKFVKRPGRGRPRKHKNSKIAAKLRERGRRERIRVELAAARKSKQYISALRERFYDVQADRLDGMLWDRLDDAIADLENTMSRVESPAKRRTLKRVI